MICESRVPSLVSVSLQYGMIRESCVPSQVSVEVAPAPRGATERSATAQFIHALGDQRCRRGWDALLASEQKARERRTDKDGCPEAPQAFSQ
ncbi:hypothetical protein NDU88_007027 [Pleurodeles waltl]|uniref:Uncharacterized protein n=1 Tax=Pleurodeles waltl TaxID=8319 RepID=A0AAV7LSF7_PLEWA|nr:hypothetical protein NDU88_007027 [Pleurodeles waltl]